MTLAEFDAMQLGFPERCYFIFNSEEDMRQGRKSGSVWNQVSDGRGGFHEKWDNNPIRHKKVKKFKHSGYQSNIIYVILEQ